MARTHDKDHQESCGTRSIGEFAKKQEKFVFALSPPALGDATLLIPPKYPSCLPSRLSIHPRVHGSPHFFAIVPTAKTLSSRRVLCPGQKAMTCLIWNPFHRHLPGQLPSVVQIGFALLLRQPGWQRPGAPDPGFGTWDSKLIGTEMSASVHRSVHTEISSGANSPIHSSTCRASELHIQDSLPPHRRLRHL
jgi:hypothetical protein